MYRYLQSATVKGQYGQSYRLNDLLSELSRATGMSQTEILKGMAGGQGFTFTDKDGSVKTIKFDGNGNAIIARSEKGISGSINLGGAVTMQSGVVKTEGVGDNMVTTYSGIFSYKGRDGKQHTLKGSVTTDASGNVVSIQGEGGAQVSDAVKEDFMNALSMGQRANLEGGTFTQDPIQLIQAIVSGRIDGSDANWFFDQLKNNKAFRERIIHGIADYWDRRMQVSYGQSKGSDEKLSANAKIHGNAGLSAFGSGFGIGGSIQKKYAAGDSYRRTKSLEANI